MQRLVAWQHDGNPIEDVVAMQVPKGLSEEQAQKDREELIKPVVAWLLNNDIVTNTADNANKVYLDVLGDDGYEKAYAYPGDWIFLVTRPSGRRKYAVVVDEGVFTSTYEVR